MGMDFFAGDYLGSFAVVAEELEALACDPFAAAAPAEPLEVLPLVVVVPAVLPLHRLVLPSIPLNRDWVSLTSYNTRHITRPFFSFAY